MIEHNLVDTYLEELWIQCGLVLDSLRLVDRSRFQEKYLKLAESWRLSDSNLSESNDGIRLFLLVARDLHPLPNKFDRQLLELGSGTTLVDALAAAAKIMPHRLVAEHMAMVDKAARRFHIPTKLENEAEFQDLLSVGAEAMFMAAQKYYRRPKGSFKNFVFPLLRESMREEQARRHPVPFKIRKKLAALGRLREEAHLRELSLGREDIAKRLRLGPEELQELLQIEGVWGNGQEMQKDTELEELEIPDHSLDQLSQLLQIEDQRRLDQAMK
ncbi:MAG: hypothetical protein NTX25_12425 [Proteobacteria bacterium]|nr:hypothetical protein [Pseudomonadota bacterium]